MSHKLKVLFVCSKNQWRSPTAETIYRNDPRLQARSAGTSPKAKRTLSSNDLQWADLILVMERKHQTRIRQRFPQESHHSRIMSLDIEDRYKAMDPRLIAELRDTVEPILEEAC